MSNTLQFKSYFLLPSNHTLCSNSVFKTNISVKLTNSALKSPFLNSSLSLLGQIRIQEPILNAKRSKRRARYRESEKLMFQLISIFASRLNILPQPLDLVIGGFNDGDAAGLGFLKVFRGGGFRRWGRMKKGNLGFLLSAMVLGLLISFYGRGLNVDLYFGVLGFVFFLIALIEGFKKNIKDWIFGLCCFVVFLGLGLKRREALKWVNEVRVSSPMVQNFTRGRKSKSRRRGF